MIVIDKKGISEAHRVLGEGTDNGRFRLSAEIFVNSHEFINLRCHQK